MKLYLHGKLLDMVQTPEPPYYVVVFTSSLNEVDEEYYSMDEFLVEEIKKIDGYYGIDNVRNVDGKGIATIYFKDLEALALWRKNEDHKKAKKGGVRKWYQEYTLRIAKVEYEKNFKRA